ncbi:sulfurtransferase [Brevibacterium casei]|uniref:Putative thiosulfate sulfurtransferase SseB n=1 Tax=Brevibacterium casei S18 TaxID=1229781 RepID=K9B1G2_9MICO|nr:sulfurtransferase [Brevibacterium casei]EKU48657.1 putative thiosulfate sulfurtransferase SseB [Brevibacterium casei S18]MCT2358036.1 sulfurtransferase [Brevibacterium casei]QQT70681.1 sulfurtransferase [Brevibacterium casei]QZE25126.1 sulfurtransferase [Brevibacterium casei]
MSRSDVLITAEELSGLTARRIPPRLLDVRWTQLRPDGRDDFARGHLPHALYVDLDSELADPDRSDPRAGRHPLPSPARFEETVRSWGIDTGTEVIVYDDNAGLGAARAWWLLRWAGLSARVLDGGIDAWVAAGGDLEFGAGSPVEPSSVVITPGSMPVIDADTAAQWDGVLLDARAPERFRGETEPFDSQAGHIPGAKNAPVTENAEGGRILSEEALRERFSELGALEDPVAVYCGSGVTACHNAMVLASLGVGSSLYPASWSGWSSDPSRSVATGA